MKKSGLSNDTFRNVFVARQPIFDRNMKVNSYELLFRTGFDNFCKIINADNASSQTISNAFFLLGMDNMTSGKKAFVNFTRNLLISDIAHIFPSKILTIEILEDIKPDREILSACRRLKKKGYTIVLDDFKYKEELEPLIDLTDIIKIDFRASNFKEQKNIFSIIKNNKIKYLAEKVETKLEFDTAIEMGYSYFQGYFFSKPVIISGKEVPGYKINYLRIIHEVNKKNVDFSKLESIIKHDVSITYKLMLFINSAAFGFHSKIHSIKQAIALLGINEFKKWVTLIAMSGMGDDKPRELMSLTITRARFCEQIAVFVGLKDNSSDLFLMGMFSMIDAFMDRPIEEVLKELPISRTIKNALLGKKNRHRAIYELVLAYEKGNWDRYSKIASLLEIEENITPEVYLNSVLWAQNFFHV